MALQIRRGQTRSFGKMIAASFAVMALLIQPVYGVVEGEVANAIAPPPAPLTVATTCVDNKVVLVLTTTQVELPELPNNAENWALGMVKYVTPYSTKTQNLSDNDVDTYSINTNQVSVDSGSVSAKVTAVYTTPKDTFFFGTVSVPHVYNQTIPADYAALNCDAFAQSPSNTHITRGGKDFGVDAVTNTSAGTSSLGQLLLEWKPAVAASGVANYRIETTLPSGAIVTSQIDSTVNSLNLKSTLDTNGAGQYRFKVTAVTNTGIEVSANEATLLYDKAAPQATIDSPLQYVNTTKPFAISGTYKDESSTNAPQSGIGRFFIYITANGQQKMFTVPTDQFGTSGMYSYVLTQAQQDQLVSQLNLKDNDSFTIKVNIFDKTNNSSSTTKDFTADNVAPKVTRWTVGGMNYANPYTLTDGQLFNSKNINAQFKDNRKLSKVVINGHDIVGKWSDPKSFDANWYMNQYTNEGLNTVTLYDAAGNSTSYKFTIDTTAPEAPMLTGDAVRYMKPGQVIRTWNKSNSGDVKEYVYKSFSSESAAQTPDTSAGWSPSDAYAAGQDAYSISHPTGNNNRTIYYRVAAVDFAGNKAWSNETFKVVVDKDPAAISIETVTLGTDKLLHFDVNASDAFSGVKQVAVNIYNENNQGSSLLNIGSLANNITPGTITVGPFSQAIDVSHLPSGTYTIRAAVFDWAMNLTYATYQFTVDNTPPTVDLAGISTTPTNVTPVIATLTFSEPVTGVDSSWTRDTTNPLVYTKTFTANATEIVNFQDVAGNTGSVEVAVANIDTTAPALVVNPYNGTDTTPTISGTTENANDLVTVDGDVATVSQIQNTDGTYSWTYTFTAPFIIGATQVNVTSTDTAGNFTRNNATVTVVDPNLTLGQAGTSTVNFTPAADQTTGQQEVQGDATSKTPQVEGASTTKNADNAAKASGMASWFWWILAAAAASFVWWLIAAARKRKSEE